MANDRTTEAQQRAEASFKKKELQLREGAKAFADYQQQYKLTDQKTARLRQARLAKEAAEREAALNAPPAAVRAKKKPAQRKA